MCHHLKYIIILGKSPVPDSQEKKKETKKKKERKRKLYEQIIYSIK